tara:strand:+ start:204 stop:407 length:204 start_codon:yes stop_codon:yes gene_type:complete
MCHQKKMMATADGNGISLEGKLLPFKKGDVVVCWESKADNLTFYGSLPNGEKGSFTVASFRLTGTFL